MKKTVLLILTLSVLTLMSATVSAHDRGDQDRGWHHARHEDMDSERGLPFAWHEQRHAIHEAHHLERIEDREWDHRFPGLHAYRWHGEEGFWHHGHYVNDAVLFFDRHDNLVSIGYMSDGVFIHIRDDHESYENHDSFFFSWFQR